MKKKDWALAAFVCVICLLFMLPRLLSAQFGLLDDGVLLLSAQAALKNLSLIWYQFQASGRFLPTALLFRALVFALAGFSPERWYLWSAFQLIVLALEMFFIARQYKSTRLQTALCVIILLASPSLVENFYTLSKSEIQLVIFVAGGILSASYYPSITNRFKRVLNIVCTFVLLLFGYGAKETAIVLPFMFLTWLVISHLTLKNSSNYPHAIQSDLILLICSVISCVVYWMLRYSLGITSLTSGAYTEGYNLFNFEKLFLNFSTLLGWIVRDFPYLIPVILASFILKPMRKPKTLAFTFKWGIWMAAWAAILIPWNFVAYYLLPFLFGAALFSGMILGQIIHLLLPQLTLDSGERSELNWEMPEKISKVGVGVLATVTLLLLLPPTINASAFATEQLLFDRANWRLIQSLEKLPQNSRVIINMPERAEYFYEIKLMVGKILNRSDITIETYQPPVQVDQHQNTYIATLTFINQVLPSVRSIHGPTIMTWKSCVDNEAVASDKIFSTRIIRSVLDVGLHRLLTFLKLGDVLGNQHNVFVSTKITYGWDVVQFAPTEKYRAMPGVYQNGVFVLQTISRSIRSVAFGQGDEVPLTGDVNGDGYTDLVLYDTKTATWKIDTNLDGKADGVFTLKGMLSGDIPFMGDWNGDGKDTPGYYRSSEAGWYLYNGFSGQPASVYHFGLQTDMPLVGDWNGDGKEDTGIYRPETGYTLLVTDPGHVDTGILIKGLPDAQAVTGLWEATTRSQLAFVKNQTWTMMAPISDCIQPNPPKEFDFEFSGVPLAGIWKDQAK